MHLNLAHHAPSQGVPDKGILLTRISAFWFSHLSSQLPHLKTHLISLGLPSSMTSGLSQHLISQLSPRSMLVRKLRILPIESIVRGYITGSAWSEYQKSSSVHGISLPSGLQESSKLDTPLWTPSTKAPAGEKDENIHPDQAKELIGADLAAKVEKLSIELYSKAHEYALSRGIIIADTKFEFGVQEGVDGGEEVVLVDEVLTPDSSRFWPKDKYEVGRGQDSFDKQYLRNWLTSNGLKGKQGVEMPEEVVKETQAKYKEVVSRLIGD